MATTTDVADLVLAVGSYGDPKKSRNKVLGRIKRTGNRLWVVLDAYYLNTILASDIRRASKDLGFGDGQEVTGSFLTKEGKPWDPYSGTVSSRDSSDGSSPSETKEDGIDF